MFVFMVLFLYANSICRFILFDCVLTGRCVLGEGWNRWRPQGRRFFVWQLGLGVVMMAAMALVIGFPVAIAIAIGMTWHSRQHPVLMVLGVLFVIFGAMAISIASMLAMVLAKDFVVPQMIGNNDMVGEPAGEAFEPFQRTDHQRILADLELADVKLRNNIMDIQDDFGSFQFWPKGREDQEIRDVVDMN